MKRTVTGIDKPLHFVAVWDIRRPTGLLGYWRLLDTRVLLKILFGFAPDQILLTHQSVFNLSLASREASAA